ncbi:hypothetical protein NCPPB3778_38 [Rathayibacter phage NCPPB3778]|nr:hypothetical protein NCPPB3778_38 [Rathayibacter phage NCPPB3778]
MMITDEFIRNIIIDTYDASEVADAADRYDYARILVAGANILDSLLKATLSESFDNPAVSDVDGIKNLLMAHSCEVEAEDDITLLHSLAHAITCLHPDRLLGYGEDFGIDDEVAS